MSYHAPDLTGIDPLHRIINDVHSVYAPNQKIFFNTAIYADSLDISLIGTVPVVKLIEGVDWEVREDDIDVPTTSRIKVYDSTFNKRLVRSVTIIRTFPGDTYLINTNYQRLYPNQIRTAIYNNETLEWTPPLAVAVLEEIDRLRLLVSKARDNVSLESDTVRYLEVDPGQVNPNNIITGEKHNIDTTAGIIYIQPIYGSFYNDDTLIIRHPITNQILVKDVDYRVVGINPTKTKISSSTNAVYDFILFIKEFVGEVEIQYHAFGGEASLANYKDLLQQVRNLTYFVNNAHFITETTLGHTSVVNALTERIVKLEDNMRRFLTGRPSYGDRTSGVSRLYKFTASDSELHWFTIATLYKVDGSDDIVNADRLHFRMSTLYSKIMADFYVSVNMNNPKDNKLDVTVLSESYPRGYIPFTDYNSIDMITRPQFRIIWNDDDVRQSGVILQVGLELKSILTESLAIEDFSGAECCWKLRDEQDEAFTPEDDNVPLPAVDGAGHPYFIWNKLNPFSRQESILFPFSKGHLIWAGVVCLNRPGGWRNIRLDHFLSADVDYRKIKRVRLELSERSSYKFPVDIELVTGLDQLTGTTSVTYYREPFDVVINITKDLETEDIIFELTTHVVEAGATPLDLMGVLIYT
jgi:hypothetical protein